MGWHTTEEEEWSHEGELLTKNFDKYTVPNVSDIPAEFHVTLLKESETPTIVYSSKVVLSVKLY
jgi:xanthine dehydrogenase large subunit